MSPKGKTTRSKNPDIQTAGKGDPSKASRKSVITVRGDEEKNVDGRNLSEAKSLNASEVKKSSLEPSENEQVNAVQHSGVSVDNLDVVASADDKEYPAQPISNQSAQGQQTQDHPSQKPAQGCLRFFVPVLIMLIACAVVYTPWGDVLGECVHGSGSVISRLNQDEYKERWENLRQSFPSQSERTWRYIISHGRGHIQKEDPFMPITFLLAALPGARKTAECLAVSVGRLFMSAGIEPALFHRGSELAQDGHLVKKLLDEHLNANLSSLSKATRNPAVVVHRLDHLPAPSPTIFFKYCDHQDAPFPKAVFLFSLELQSAPASHLTESKREGFVETYLTTELWSETRNKAYVKTTSEALVARVADTVLLIEPEKDTVLQKLNCL